MPDAASVAYTVVQSLLSYDAAHCAVHTVFFCWSAAAFCGAYEHNDMNGLPKPPVTS
jgi:hypothetical protein